ncbi:Cytosolic fatty-acid binding domain and Calycin-like domain and Calycin domain-containing protein [Aphelenchoides besseyi]|nr:Cytosolic fatty-acid binding domain and Calycin-like domain and Calycin domain-containing protein [Aphelenchoides besseyi]KAI6208502.1 Cytosolic fatty-acid binding domain and Calycin-like domain and Calycin domain-containing protein [Aphelenchoides besseyi]
MTSDKVKQLVGSWKHESAENVDAFLKAVGIGMILRKVASTQKPLVKITVDGDEWHVAIESAFKNHSWNFALNKRNKITTIDGRTFWATYTDEDGVLVEKQESLEGEKTVPAVTRRWVEGDKLLMTEEANGVVAKRSFTRVA